MIKVSYFIRRLPAFSMSDFHSYWRDNHAPLIKKHAGLFGICRYVKLHARLDERIAPAANLPEPFDGVAEPGLSHLKKWSCGFKTPRPKAGARARKFATMNGSLLTADVPPP